MSHIVTMAMELRWSSYVLVALFAVDAARSHRGSQGLVCVNDFVNNVSCTWSGSQLAPAVDCLISGAKETRIIKNNRRIQVQMIRTCKVKQLGNCPPGCSFVFENEEFNSFKYISYISMECNGTLMENLTNYKPCNHIKMHPPGVPNVSSIANETWISWSPGSPRSDFFKSFNFQVHITQKNQTWKEASRLSTQKEEVRILAWQLKGHCQVRVRVRPSDRDNSHWSNWSPTTSWMGATDMVATSQDQDWFLDQTSLVMWGVMFSVGLILIVILVLYRSCMSKGFHEVKTIPNPSQYFHSLHSVHGGNLKKWLNPLSASESFFTAHPCDHISPVELCESWDVVPSTSPFSSSTSALLHLKSRPSAVSDTSGAVDNSSTSFSSCFSNVGYFMSSSSSSSARTDPIPAYFTYQEDFNLSFSPSLTPCPVYDSLKRGPHSPDSGFGIGKEDEEDREDKNAVDAEEEKVSDAHQSSPLHILPLSPPPQMSPPFSPSPPPNTPSLTQVFSDSQQVDVPVAVACGSYAAWSMAGAMCRSSSMPVEPCKTGYLTLKELQTTFSNKSI